MRSPRDELQSLIQRGKWLQSEASKIASEARIAGPKVEAGVRPDVPADACVCVTGG